MPYTLSDSRNLHITDKISSINNSTKDSSEVNALTGLLKIDTGKPNREFIQTFRELKRRHPFINDLCRRSGFIGYCFRGDDYRAKRYKIIINQLKYGSYNTQDNKLTSYFADAGNLKKTICEKVEDIKNEYLKKTYKSAEDNDYKTDNTIFNELSTFNNNLEFEPSKKAMSTDVHKEKNDDISILAEFVADNSDFWCLPAGNEATGVNIRGESVEYLAQYLELYKNFVSEAEKAKTQDEMGVLETHHQSAARNLHLQTVANKNPKANINPECINRYIRTIRQELEQYTNLCSRIKKSTTLDEIVIIRNEGKSVVTRFKDELNHMLTQQQEGIASYNCYVEKAQKAKTRKEIDYIEKEAEQAIKKLNSDQLMTSLNLAFHGVYQTFTKYEALCSSIRESTTIVQISKIKLDLDNDILKSDIQAILEQQTLQISTELVKQVVGDLCIARTTSEFNEIQTKYTDRCRLLSSYFIDKINQHIQSIYNELERYEELCSKIEKSTTNEEITQISERVHLLDQRFSREIQEKIKMQSGIIANLYKNSQENWISDLTNLRTAAKDLFNDSEISVKTRAYYDRFCKLELKNISNKTNIKPTIVIGDLDGDVSRVILMVYLQDPKTFFEIKGDLISLMNLVANIGIPANEATWLNGIWEHQASNDVAKLLSNILDRLTSIQSPETSQLFTIVNNCDVLFDRMSNSPIITCRILKELRRLGGVINLRGNHELYPKDEDFLAYDGFTLPFDYRYNAALMFGMHSLQRELTEYGSLVEHQGILNKLAKDTFVDCYYSPEMNTLFRHTGVGLDNNLGYVIGLNSDNNRIYQKADSVKELADHLNRQPMDIVNQEDILTSLRLVSNNDTGLDMDVKLPFLQVIGHDGSPINARKGSCEEMAIRHYGITTTNSRDSNPVTKAQTLKPNVLCVN